MRLLALLGVQSYFQQQKTFRLGSPLSHKSMLFKNDSQIISVTIDVLEPQTTLARGVEDALKP